MLCWQRVAAVALLVMLALVPWISAMPPTGVPSGKAHPSEPLQKLKFLDPVDKRMGSSGRELWYDLSLDVVTAHLGFGPNVDALLRQLCQVSALDDCSKLTTRGYNGKLAAPMIHLQPGDVVHVTLTNNLPPAPVDTSAVHNYYRDYDKTNLHTHGLHISALAPSDSIEVEITPGESHTYTFRIPEDHMGGIHLYHPHWHGSTAMQAGGGAAGLIVVEDPPHLLPPEVSAIEEVFLTLFHLDIANLKWLSERYIDCCAGYPGMPQDVSGYPECQMVARDKAQSEANRAACKKYALFDDIHLSDEGASFASAVLVNGQFRPTLRVIAGRWYRLRVLYVAVTKFIQFEMPGCEFKLLAKDGIYLNTAPRDVKAGILSSGNRADLLVRCPAGTHIATTGELIDLEASTRRTNDLITDEILVVEATAVEGEPVCEPPVFQVNRPCYLVDLVNTPPTMEPVDLVMGPVNENSTQFNTVNDEVWHNFTTYLATLPVGGVAQINVAGTVEHHPVHIHVNPYQIVTDMPANASTRAYFQQGDWHDTLLIADPGTCDEKLPSGFVTQKNPTCVFPWGDTQLRFQTDRFTGLSIVHCHILKHEDQGMMASFNIVGEEGTRWEGAQAIDRTCYTRQVDVQPPTILQAGSCCQPCASVPGNPSLEIAGSAPSERRPLFASGPSPLPCCP